MKSLGLRIAIPALVLMTTAVVLDALFPPDLSRARRYSALVVDRDGEPLRGFTNVDDAWRLPLAPEAVDPLFIELLIAFEDRRFYRHPGVDPLAVLRAVGQYLANGQVVSGASTLTMQTARLLEPRPRTLAAKLKEVLRALQLEWRFDKSTVLSLYLDLAPYGGNLEGLRAASLAYLGKEPQRLTAAEAALLVVLPQAPSRLRPDRHPQRARAERDKVLERMRALGVLTPAQVREARQEALPTRRRPMPFLAAHLARRLRAAEPGLGLYRTTVEGELQRTLETLAARERQTLGPRAGLAMLVADNRSRDVLAYVGSADFFDAQRAGQVDMVQAIRSPGSALKPLIYGLGFDDLVIHPETLIDDVPTRFGDYSPSNFQNAYLGQISVREALQRSQNIPAVAVLERIGPKRLAARLREVGLVLRWGAEGGPGLPLALGGVGTSLADLVALYAGFADGGLVKPLRYRVDTPPESGKRLLSATASWYLKDILQGAPAPAAVALPSSVAARGHAIAYKTGTSYGFRDAWAIGFDDRHTVGVWVGRADGSPSPGHYGRNTAAPLLFRVFDLLPRPRSLPSLPPDQALRVERAELPQPLRALGTAATRRSAGAPLRIAFPVDGSTVELHAGGNLPLVANGGQRPLRWLVNGRLLSTSALRRKAFWRADGAGLVQVTVIDRTGQTDNAAVWLSTPSQNGS